MSETLDPKTLDDLRQKAKDSLYFFAKGVLGFDWLTPDIHRPMCEILENYEKNQRVKITLPRGWLKTTLCSQAYPMWRAIRDPNVRVLLVQNTFTNAVGKLRTIKSLFETCTILRALFPEVLPTKDCVWKGDSLCLNRNKSYNESTFEAAGTKTTTTSRHYDVIIEDDTVAPDLDDMTKTNVIPSRDDIDQAIGWHRLAPPLLTDHKTGQILVVGTRWYEEDLLSWIDENEGSIYFSYSRAVRENENGEPDVKGQIAYPGRFDAQVLDELEASMGPYLYSCLYMNRPMQSKDMIFHASWISLYETEPQTLITYTTVDPAGDPAEAKGETDFNVVCTTGKDLRTGLVYVLEYTRERCNPSELIGHLFKHVRKWSPVKVRIEKVAYQNTLLHWIRERMRKDNTYFAIEGVTQGGRSKASRIMGLQPIFSNDGIKLRGWMQELISELLAFPLGKTDDIIDALSMHIDMWALTQGVQPKSDQESDRFTLLGAIEELKGRHKHQGYVVSDILGKKKLLTWAN